jgi:hypothetical protein
VRGRIVMLPVAADTMTSSAVPTASQQGVDCCGWLSPRAVVPSSPVCTVVSAPPAEAVRRDVGAMHMAWVRCVQA